jgi:molybdopterin-containing oxidoreductase family membrane subunit
MRAGNEIKSQNWLQWVAWILTVVCLAAGAYGLYLRFTKGYAAANYGSYVPWGLWIAAYVALIGASAGAFGFAAVVFTIRKTEYYGLARLAMLVALGAFAAGMTNVWLDLGHPFRFWKLLVETSWTSIMGWMSWFYVIYGLILVVGLFLTRNGVIPKFIERFSWLAFLFAIAFAGAEGALFGVVGARALWESGLTPILFLVEAALFGVGLVVAAAAIFGKLNTAAARTLGVLMLILLAGLIVLEWAEYSTGLYASVPAKSSAIMTILIGPYWWVFWGLHLGIGVVLPGLLLLFGRGNVLLTGLAGGLIAAMGLATKLNLVLPALAQGELEGLVHAFTGPGLAFTYFPSKMEWLVWLGTLGLGGLIVLTGFRLFGLAKPTQSGSTSK